MVSCSEQSLPKDFVLEGTEEELRMVLKSSQTNREASSRHAIRRLKEIQFDDEVPYETTNQQANNNKVSQHQKNRCDNKKSKKPSAHGIQHQTTSKPFKPCPWIRTSEPDIQAIVKAFSTETSIEKSPRLDFTLFPDDDSVNVGETDSKLLHVVSVGLNCLDLDHSTGETTSTNQSANDDFLQGISFLVQDSCLTNKSGANSKYLKKGSLSKRYKKLVELSHKHRLEEEQRTRREHKPPTVYENEKSSLTSQKSRPRFYRDTANGLHGGGTIAFARGNFDRELLVALEANLDNRKNRQRLLRYQKAVRDEKHRVEEESRKNTDSRMTKGLVKSKVEQKHLSLRQKQKLAQQKEQEMEKSRKEQKEKENRARQNRTISKGKRLWLKAFRKIILIRALQNTSTAPKCVPQDYIDSKTGQRVIMFTAMPKEETAPDNDKNKGRRKRRNQNETSDGEYKSDDESILDEDSLFKSVEQSVTLLTCVKWFSDYELNSDDMLMQIAERAGAKEWEKIRKQEELEEWLALPEPIITVNELNLETLVLEARLAMSRQHIWKAAQKIDYSLANQAEPTFSGIEGLNSAPPPKNETSVTKAHDIFLKFWKNQSNKKVRILRNVFLEEEVLIACEDDQIKKKAKQQLGKIVSHTDSQSRIRGRRQDWRDFRQWYFYSSSRKEFLQEAYINLVNDWNSSWATYIRYQQVNHCNLITDASISLQPDEGSCYSVDFETDDDKDEKSICSSEETGPSDSIENFGPAYILLEMRELIQSFASTPEEIRKEYERENSFGANLIWKNLSEDDKYAEGMAAIRCREVQSLALLDGLGFLNDLVELDAETLQKDERWQLFFLWYPAHAQTRAAFLTREVISVGRDFIRGKQYINDIMISLRLDKVQWNSKFKFALTSMFNDSGKSLLEREDALSPTVKKIVQEIALQCYQDENEIFQHKNKSSEEREPISKLECHTKTDNTEVRWLSSKLKEGKELHRVCVEVSEKERMAFMNRITIDYSKTCRQVQASHLEMICNHKRIKSNHSRIEDKEGICHIQEMGTLEKLEIARIKKVACGFESHLKSLLVIDIVDYYLNILYILTKASLILEEQHSSSAQGPFELNLGRGSKQRLNFTLTDNANESAQNPVKLRKKLASEAITQLRQFSLQNQTVRKARLENNDIENKEGSGQMDQVIVLDKYIRDILSCEMGDKKLISEASKQVFEILNRRAFENLLLAGINVNPGNNFMQQRSVYHNDIRGSQQKTNPFIVCNTAKTDVISSNPKFRDFWDWYFSSYSFRAAYMKTRSDIWDNYRIEMRKRGDTIHGASIFDEEESLTTPPIDAETKKRMWFIDIKSWYTVEELEKDDETMRASEEAGRGAIEKEIEELKAQQLIDMRNKFKTELAFDSDYDSDIDEEAGTSQLENKKRFRCTRKVRRKEILILTKIGWENGSGLKNGDEEYYANWEANEAKRLFLEAEENRRKAELQLMRTEEDTLRRWLVDQRRQMLRLASEKYLNNMVYQQRQEEEERRNDPTGLCEREKSRYNRNRMSFEDEDNKKRWKLIQEHERWIQDEEIKRLQREHEEMIFEDRYAYNWRKETEEIIQKEYKSAENEKAQMYNEDLTSYLMGTIWDKEREQEKRKAMLEAIAFSSFMPFYKDSATSPLLHRKDPDVIPLIREENLKYSSNLPDQIVEPKMNLSLSNKFQQVIGIPSDCRSNFRKKRAKVGQKLERRRNKPVLKPMARCKSDLESFGGFLDHQIISSLSSIPFSPKEQANEIESNHKNKTSTIPQQLSRKDSPENLAQLEKPKINRDADYRRPNTSILGLNDSNIPVVFTRSLPTSISELELNADSLRRPYSCPQTGMERVSRSSDILPIRHADNSIIRLPSLISVQSEFSLQDGSENLLPWE